MKPKSRKRRYKAMLWIMAILILAGPVAFAEDTAPVENKISVSVRPEVVARMYEDADQALGGGVNFDIEGIFPNPNIVVIPGFELISSEIDAIREGIDIDVVSSRIAVGYDFDLSDGLTIRPYVGLDFAFINGEEFKSKNEIGQSFGVNLIKQLTDNAGVFLGIGYQNLDTKIEGTEVDLGNVNFKSGFAIKF